VSHAVAQHIGSLPPVSSLFAAVLGVNPLQHLLSMEGVLHTLSADAQHALTGHQYFPQLLSAPFHHGLTIVFGVSAGLAFVAAAASLSRGRRNVPTVVEAAPADREPVGAGVGSNAGLYREADDAFD